MNILLVTPWKLTAVGGISTVVKMLSHEFGKQGHQTPVLSTDGDNGIVRTDQRDGVPVYEIYLRTPYVEKAPVRGFISFCLFVPVTLYRLHRFLSRHRVEVVSIQYPLANIFYFGVLRWFSDWKLVVTYQGNDAHNLPLWSVADRLFIRVLLLSSDCVTAVSKSLSVTVMKMFPFLRRKRCCIIPNGAPLDLVDQVAPLNGLAHLPARYILSAGMLVPRKGFDVLIKAIRLARDCGVDVNVVIAGEGPEREALTRLTEEVGVSEHVTFVGNQSHGSVMGLMKKSRHFVLASRAEGMPLVIAEAMACGKAVVATNVDGVSEIVKDGQTGILVKCDDTKALAQALLKLYREPELCETLAMNGKEWARKEFSWEAIAGRYLKLFGEC